MCRFFKISPQAGEGRKMTFDEAKNFRMPLGKHGPKAGQPGRTLDAIAGDNDGLRYLDWLRGEREGQRSKLDDALRAYLDDPAIEKELDEL